MHPAVTAMVPPSQRQRSSLEVNPALGFDGRPYDGSSTGGKGPIGGSPTAPDSTTPPEVSKGDGVLPVAPLERAFEVGGGGGEGMKVGEVLGGTAASASTSLSTRTLGAQAKSALNYGRVKAFGVTTRYSHLQHLQVGAIFAFVVPTAPEGSQPCVVSGPEAEGDGCLLEDDWIG